MTLHNTSHYLLPSFIISSLQSIMIINSSTLDSLSLFRLLLRRYEMWIYFPPFISNYVFPCFTLLHNFHLLLYLLYTLNHAALMHSRTALIICITKKENISEMFQLWRVQIYSIKWWMCCITRQQFLSTTFTLHCLTIRSTLIWTQNFPGLISPFKQPSENTLRNCFVFEYLSVESCTEA